MNATANSEYRQLELDSSNDLMDYDGEKGLGRYPEAAWYAQRAGTARARMGQIMFDAGEYAAAAEDWLSAGACFFLAAQRERLRTCLHQVLSLQQRGLIPSERTDLFNVVRDREADLRELEDKVEKAEQLIHAPGERGAALLGKLLKKVRDLPGMAKMHVAISQTAHEIGQADLATRHLEWAEKFNPGSPTHVEIRVRRMIEQNEWHSAVAVAREGLRAHPDRGLLRVLLAHALVGLARGQSAPLEEASSLLKSVGENLNSDESTLLLAFALGAIVCHELGRPDSFRWFVDRFNQLAGVVQRPVQKQFVMRVRQELALLFSSSGTNGPQSLGGKEPPSGRGDLQRFIERMPSLVGAVS